MKVQLRRAAIAFVLLLNLLMIFAKGAHADDLQIVAVEGQPLAMNVKRLFQAFELLGTSSPVPLEDFVSKAIQNEDARDL